MIAVSRSSSTAAGSAEPVRRLWSLDDSWRDTRALSFDVTAAVRGFRAAHRAGTCCDGIVADYLAMTAELMRCRTRSPQKRYSGTAECYRLLASDCNRLIA